MGAGIGRGQLAMNDQLGIGVWRNVHNVYLEYAVDLGLPGLVLFLLLLGSALGGARLTARLLRRAGAPRAFVSLHAGTQVSLIAFAIGGLLNPGAYGWVVHYAVGMAVASRITFGAWSAVSRKSPSRERAS
jgi:O-antigen ligase